VKRIGITTLAALALATGMIACAEEQAGQSMATTAAATEEDTTSEEEGTTSEAELTTEQEQAVESARSYVDLGGFSRTGLIQQLSSKAGEGFPYKVAVFAVDYLHVDWKKEAVESAKSYLELGGFSRASLLQQLSSKAGEGFTRAQAEYAVKKVYG
jgi:hypothetical protein